MVNRAKIAGYIIITRIHHYTRGCDPTRSLGVQLVVRTMEILIVGEQVRLTADSIRSISSW